jgi:starch phosphorylase
MDINARAGELAQRIKHLLITTSGHTSTTATIEEFYTAFSLALREEIMINAAATIETTQSKKLRTVNFISMEYMPGRLLWNNICNMNSQELVQAVLKKMNRNFEDLISCETDPGLGNGGLGRLASCFLDSLATLHYPARAYGLRYQYGIFEQELWNGVQVERPDCWLLNADPWEGRRDLFSVNIHFRGQPVHATNMHGEEVYLIEDGEEVRAVPFDIPIIGYSKKADYSTLLLRLWSTKESPRNFLLQRYNAGLLDQASENTSLTDVLYPNDNNELGKRVRLKQEFILVSASLQDIYRRHLHLYGDMLEFKDKVRIQLNDTHPALMIAEMMRTLTKNFDFSWKEALETCQACCSYTNHTILKEALEEWSEVRMQELLPRQYRIIQRLNLDLCTQVRKQFPDDEEKVRRLSMIENGQIRMANLSIFGSHQVNGVAKIHSNILKKSLFKDFYEMYPEKFTNVTNGVTQRRWLLHANPLLAEFISKRIGEGWITDFPQIANLRKFSEDLDSQVEFLEIKKKNKQALLSFLTRENFIRDSNGKIISHSHILDESALFDVHIKRFHEYKRQLMNVLHLLMISQEPVPRAIKRLALFGGKAAPGYQMAKQIIQLISAVERKFNKDPKMRDHLAIAFIENYNVSKAEIVIPAADLSEQISAAGWEASGTGNMKMSINGALTIGTEDGANIEMHESVGKTYWPFSFGATAEENLQPYHPGDIYTHDEQIRRAVDSLLEANLAENASELAAFHQIHYHLKEHDTFRVLKDLRSYYETQKKVEELYLQPKSWAKVAIENIAAMGVFSADESVRNYAKEIWGIKPSPLDPKILQSVRSEYLEHDRCNIP